MQKTGSSLYCFNCFLQSEQWGWGASVLVASLQAALLGRQYHKIAPRVQLRNRLHFSQGAGLSWKTKSLLVMGLYLASGLLSTPHSVQTLSVSLQHIFFLLLFYSILVRLRKISWCSPKVSVRNLHHLVLTCSVSTLWALCWCRQQLFFLFSGKLKTNMVSF